MTESNVQVARRAFAAVLALIRWVVIMRPPSPGGRPASPIANLSTFRDGRVVEMVHYPEPADAVAAARARRA